MCLAAFFLAVASLFATAQSPTPQVTAATELQSRLQAASAAQQAGDPDAIAAANKRVIALGLKEMGDLRNLVGAYPAAIELYKRSLELEPTEENRYSLALAYFRAPRPDEGLKESEILVKGGSEERRLLESAGQALDTEEGLPAGRRLIEQISEFTA